MTTTYSRKNKRISFVMAVLIIASLLGLSMAACTAAYADDMVYDPNGTNEGTIDVSYHQYSSFGVTVPITVSVGTEYSVQLQNVNLEDGYKVKVGVSNLNDSSYIVLTNSKDSSATINCTITNVTGSAQLTTVDSTLASFTASDITQDGVCIVSTPSKFVVSSAADAGATIKAGTYAGQICYRVDCSEITE